MGDDERRNEKRYDCFGKTLNQLKGTEETFRAFVLDVSKTGMKIQSQIALDIGSDIEIQLDLPRKEFPESSPIILHGKIKWVDEEATPVAVGIEFTELDQDTVNKLESFIKIW